MKKSFLTVSMFIYLFFTPSYGDFDSLKCAFGIDTLFLPIKDINRWRDSDYIVLFPYDDWGIKISYDYFGLPDYTIQSVRNGFIEEDVLFANIPFLWEKSHFFTAKYSKGRIHHERAGYSPKPVTGFSYYKGDYGFLNVSAFASGRYYNKGIWGFELSNLGYDGRFGLLGSKYGRTTGESINQNYRLDFETKVSDLTITSGVFYNKYMPGIVYYSNTEFTYRYAGSEREYRKGGYVSVTRTNNNRYLQAGVLTSGFYYSRDFGTISIKGEGAHSQLYCNFGHTLKKIKLEVGFRLLRNEFFKRSGRSYKQRKIHLFASGEHSSAKRDILIKAGALNSRPNIEFEMKQLIFRKFLLNIGYYKKLYMYPLAFTVLADTSTKTGEEFQKGFVSSSAEIGIKWKTEYLNLHLGVRHTAADFYTPFKSNPGLNLVVFNVKNTRKISIISTANIHFKHWIILTNKTIYSPEAEENSSSLYNISSLEGSFNALANLKIHYYGSFWYVRGYKEVAWFEEIRSIGQIEFDVFNNERLFFSFEVGAKVKSFYIFYSFYNIQGRLFSSLPLMPYRNRLFVYGIRWWFIE